MKKDLKIIHSVQIRGEKYDVADWQKLQIEDKRAVVLGLCKHYYEDPINPTKAKKLLAGAMDEEVEKCVLELVEYRKAYLSDSYEVSYAFSVSTSLACLALA